MKSKHFFKTMVIIFLCPIPFFGQLPNETKLISQPAISANHIAFIYAEDLWIANQNGSNPIRLTIDKGIESQPIFSPDGQTIAFNAQYDGNTDVYTIPISGGIPKRLTWHPDGDFVRDFTPDGTKLIFASQRNSFTNRYLQLYSIATSGGNVNQLEIPNAFWASYSEDGNHIAYTPLYEPYAQWKHYRGGMESRIWIFDINSHKVEEIPRPKNQGNNTKPQWMGSNVYFRSDVNGEFNLFSYNTNSKQTTQITKYKDFPVLSLSASNGKVIFEQAGVLHIYDESSEVIKTIKLNISTDLLELRERYVSGKSYVRWASISPSGNRVVVDFRGDVITVPVKKGDPNNLTQSTGTHEKFPQWSPDGKTIAYFSDESGEYALHLKSLKDNSLNKVSLKGTGFYANIHWSPDSKKLCFIDNGRNLYLYNVTTNKTVKINADEMYFPGPFRDLFGDWSFDSNWVSYTTITETNFETAHLYNISEDKSYSVSEGLANVSEPIFDPSGKYLYLLASTDAGPVVNWFDQSNNDMNSTNSIYIITLQKETISPFKKENDQEEIKKDDTEDDENKDGKEQKNKVLKIDWDGFSNRIIDVPIGSKDYRNLDITKEGELFYIASKDDKPTLHKYDLKKRKEESIMPASDFEISSNGKKMLYQNNQNLGVADLGKKPSDGPINFSTIKVKINPKKEWNNIFEETWRVNRDYFYDPGMHGVNWLEMKDKYKSFLPHVSCKSDLYRIMTWMCGELGVGHHRFGSRGDRMVNPNRISGGLLGADYIVKNDRYQISKIYGGLNWNPNLRSPLTEPGVNAKIGDYIISVNGNEIRAKDNLYHFFENTANKLVKLEISSNSDGSSSKIVEVTPVGNERTLRNRDWVEGNMKKVHEATNGEVAYVYVPNTAGLGHQYFKRYFFPQANKKAIIVDERFNGGGQLADYYIDMLKKPVQAYWNYRYGKDHKSPSASIQGPKVMITDETAGSGGDYLPWMFKKFKLGTVVGKRTWGGLVGVLGYPEFIDGGSVTAPNVAFYTEDGFRVENEGVAPDVEVEQWPEEVIKGQDPQLEKAIEIVLDELKSNPPKKIKRPNYPIKTKD
ncbi:MAG: peptidase S41 [Bacteroidetes bacterium MedPE-SWsnd-G1]|nr:MAG: peptidase S41 [Bacteroidetes bacterium MedPE-SWsnd-G1]